MLGSHRPRDIHLKLDNPPHLRCHDRRHVIVGDDSRAMKLPGVPCAGSTRSALDQEHEAVVFCILDVPTELESANPTLGDCRAVLACKGAQRIYLTQYGWAKLHPAQTEGVIPFTLDLQQCWHCCVSDRACFGVDMAVIG